MPSLPYAGCTPLTDLPEWTAFQQAGLAASFSAEHLHLLAGGGLELDLSAQRHSPALAEAGRALLEARQFSVARAALLEGEAVNTTENRAAWHSILRAACPHEDVAQERKRMEAFVDAADAADQWSDIVHIGIGGSDWGVRLVANACSRGSARRNLHFVANLDGHALDEILAGLDPARTLVIVTSKSFSTNETLTNLRRTLAWLQAEGVSQPLAQIVAVTARPEAAAAEGIAPERIFRLWDWVGGRFSIWSSVALPVALSIGLEAVNDLREGAAEMDIHFAQAPVDSNLPVQLALSGVLNRSVLGFCSLSVAAYDARLQFLAPYLQQLDMESLGKSVDLGGNPMKVPTGPAVWGMPGTDGQHTFFQWLHQGTDGAAVDFVICQEADHPWRDDHAMLLANCLAQRQTLLLGTSEQAEYERLCAQGEPSDKAEWLARHRSHPGGRPSTLIVLPRLTPHTLGALLALYEHKVFVQGVIWGINPFDQWGVEAGKTLASGIQRELSTGEVASEHDQSTHYWITRLASSTRD
ncbi:glucose-6-phosphate isomerase [Pseudomonadota bacterium AL_CKDN230030165-1A_HGKHYDSX7]